MGTLSKEACRRSGSFTARPMQGCSTAAGRTPQLLFGGAGQEDAPPVNSNEYFEYDYNKTLEYLTSEKFRERKYHGKGI